MPPARRFRAAGALLAVSLALAAVAAPEAPAYAYEIATSGKIEVDVRAFARTVAATYADRRGWKHAGNSFRRVPAGSSSDFTVVLAASDRMTSFSSSCSPSYSCRVGRHVIVNQDRWRHGVHGWPGTLLSYRQMVINHETGHWLGLGHLSCPAPGALAPVMQQQSISLQGCRPNPWPSPARSMRARLLAREREARRERASPSCCVSRAPTPDRGDGDAAGDRALGRGDHGSLERNRPGDRARLRAEGRLGRARGAA